MSKKTIAILIVVLILLIFFSGCLHIKNDELDKENKEAHENFEVYTQFNVASVYDQSIYFIGKDNTLYKTDASFKNIAQYNTTKMKLFAFIDKYLVFIDMVDKLHVFNLYGDSEKVIDWNASTSARKAKGFSYKSFTDSIIYEDRIIYRTEENQLHCLYLDNFKKEILSKKEVMNVIPYKNKIIYSVRYNRIITPYILEEYDLLERKTTDLANHYVYKMRNNGDYIYYINNYSLYRLSMLTKESQLLMSDSTTIGFEVSDNMLMSVNSHGLVQSDLDGTNQVIIDKEALGEAGIANAKNDIFIIVNSNNQIFSIYNGKSDVEVSYQNRLLNCVFLDNLLFMRFGEIKDDEIKIDTIRIYNLEGYLLYVY